MILPDIFERVRNYKYSQIFKIWGFYSEVLQCKIKVPIGFWYDHESTPYFKGTSHRGGLAHDYLCRKDSIPVVTKKQAADVYLEIMTFQDNAAWLRWAKYWVVRYWPGYFHKHSVNASYEELSGEKNYVAEIGS